MRCAKAQRLISDHIDKLLNGRQTQALEQHLRGCSVCTELLNDMQMIAGEAKNMKSVLPSENLWAGIESQISRNDRKIKNWPNEIGEFSRFSLYSGNVTLFPISFLSSARTLFRRAYAVLLSLCENSRINRQILK